MEKLHDLSYILPIIIGLSFAIVFLQSGIDKVIDRKGNLDWLKGHFKDSILKSTVSLNLTIITVLEIIAGLISLGGVIYYLVSGSDFWIEQGLILSMITLMMLLFGQRVAKDYEGAKTIVIYLALAFVSSLILM